MCVCVYLRPRAVDVPGVGPVPVSVRGGAQQQRRKASSDATLGDAGSWQVELVVHGADGPQRPAPQLYPRGPSWR